MKITIIIGVLLLSCTNYSFAQFGKIKIKKPKITAPSKSKPSNSNSTSSESNKKSSTTQSSTSSSNTGRTSEGAPTRRSELPSYETYSKVRDNIRYAKSAMEDASWKISPDEKSQSKILNYLSKAKENLDILNQDPAEKDRAYLKQFNEDYPLLKKQCMDDLANYSNKSQYIDRLEEYNRWVALGSDYSNDNFTPNYKDYEALLAGYEKEQPEHFKNSSRTQKIVATVNNHFEVDVYKKVDDLEQDVNALIKNIHRLNSRQEETYLLNADNYLKKFEKPTKLLEEYKQNLLKDHTSANALTAKMDKEKSMLEEYINSGKLAAHQAKYAQEIIDSKRLRKGMSDSKIESYAKDELPAKYGKILRVTIASPGWYVNKNAYIPLNKNVQVEFATQKEDGKCYYVGAIIRRNYEGGGVYSDTWYMTGIWNDGEMNCKNVNK